MHFMCTVNKGKVKRTAVSIYDGELEGVIRTANLSTYLC